MHWIYIKKSYCLHELFTPSAVFSNFPLFFFLPSPSSRSWRGAFWSRFLWRKSDSKFRREVVLSPPPRCPNISLCSSLLSPLLPSLSYSSSVFVYEGQWELGPLWCACLWLSGCYRITEKTLKIYRIRSRFHLWSSNQYAAFDCNYLDEEPCNVNINKALIKHITHKKDWPVHCSQMYQKNELIH